MPTLNKMHFCFIPKFLVISLSNSLKETCFDLKRKFVLFYLGLFCLLGDLEEKTCTAFTVCEVCHRCLLTTLEIYCEIYHIYHKNTKCVPIARWIIKQTSIYHLQPSKCIRGHPRCPSQSQTIPSQPPKLSELKYVGQWDSPFVQIRTERLSKVMSFTHDTACWWKSWAQLRFPDSRSTVFSVVVRMSIITQGRRNFIHCFELFS